MSQQPRKTNGQFGNKLAGPTPTSGPSVPDRNQLSNDFKDYDKLGEQQEKELQGGLASVGESLDSIIEIYRNRSERRQAQIDSTQKQLDEIREKLDEISTQRADIERRYHEQQEKRLSNRLRRFFARNRNAS